MLAFLACIGLAIGLILIRWLLEGALAVVLSCSDELAEEIVGWTEFWALVLFLLHHLD